MGKPVRDPYTGRMTTGHEWNGIIELNTPVPKLVLLFLALTFLSSVIIWLLAPAWPGLNGYTKGILGIDQRTTLEHSLKKSAIKTAQWRANIENLPFDDISRNSALMATVRDHGARLFEDNCAMCHGPDGQGGGGFPNLVDDQWLWGGDPETIMETLRVGVNSGHDEARISQMMAYGRDGILTLEQRRAVAKFVLSLSSDDEQEPTDAEVLPLGAEVFGQHCVSCHGPDGRGMQSVGAPNLTDDFWIYGGDTASIEETLRNGRQGVMPNWDERLSIADRKVLTLYIRELTREAPQ
ncbi:cytochrome-c oxidase, cbb3-type subunit III [Hyphococcus sp.]|uniref:cytochrome-c oxidase, cbb3-type subunit III n=1 Tax=Hyphococcus sp. TaxID=2038636 RepID=UPI002085B56B|nr:MAG: Cbb3-type cytochrome c oxidase subunit [Marinicaulis sp.]